MSLQRWAREIIVRKGDGVDGEVDPGVPPLSRAKGESFAVRGVGSRLATAVHHGRRRRIGADVRDLVDAARDSADVHLAGKSSQRPDDDPEFLGQARERFNLGAVSVMLCD